jgi:hypothetical protein
VLSFVDYWHTVCSVSDAGWVAQRQSGTEIIGHCLRRLAGVGGVLMFNTMVPSTLMIIGVIAYSAWAGLTWTLGITYLSEIFPTAVRGSGFGLSVGVGRITSTDFRRACNHHGIG